MRQLSDSPYVFSKLLRQLRTSFSLNFYHVVGVVIFRKGSWNTRQVPRMIRVGRKISWATLFWIPWVQHLTKIPWYNNIMILHVSCRHCDGTKQQDTMLEAKQMLSRRRFVVSVSKMDIKSILGNEFKIASDDMDANPWIMVQNPLWKSSDDECCHIFECNFYDLHMKQLEEKG